MRRSYTPLRALVLGIMLATLCLPWVPFRVHAQAETTPEPSQKRVQIVEGEITPYGHGQVYLVQGLKAQDKLFVLAESMTGNLDPLLALVHGDTDAMAINLAFNDAVNQAVAAGKDPLAMLPQFANTHFLIWDDDSGPGYSAALEYTIPTDGDYQLLLYPNPALANWGKYRIVVGVNTPDGLTGQIQPSGEHFVSAMSVFPPLRAVQEITGTVDADHRPQFILRPLSQGDTVYAYAEPISGSLPLLIKLMDYGDKPLALGFDQTGTGRVTLKYQVQEDASGYSLQVSSLDATQQGAFRLLMGINAPEVATGQAQPTPGQPVLEEPIKVQIGIRMDQITSVDQKAENFGVVNTLQMEWQDPRLAFDPADCNCRVQTLTPSQFTKFVNERGASWPEFVYFNQQGRRDIQSSVIAVFSNGKAIYFERSSVTLQAPDFDFRLYPFDVQTFYIRIRMVFPERYYVFEALPGFSKTGEQLGEEEWVIQKQWTEIASVDGVSQFSFGFAANRHLMYYIVRIFVPVLLIIIVSWFTFFLKDYGKRVDVASANLLIFVAFNFTISDALPHLGYATILDLVLVTTFVITGIVVVFNVWLKRLEVTKKESIAQTIDKYSIWLYPIMYFAAFALVSFFFVR